MCSRVCPACAGISSEESLRWKLSPGECGSNKLRANGLQIHWNIFNPSLSYCFHFIFLFQRCFLLLAGMTEIAQHSDVLQLCITETFVLPNRPFFDLVLPSCIIPFPQNINFLHFATPCLKHYLKYTVWLECSFIFPLSCYYVLLFVQTSEIADKKELLLGF